MPIEQTAHLFFFLPDLSLSHRRRCVPVRRDTWNTAANRPDLVGLIGPKCSTLEAWRVPLTPWGLGGDPRGESRFVCFKVSQAPQRLVHPTDRWTFGRRPAIFGVLETPRQEAC